MFDFPKNFLILLFFLTYFLLYYNILEIIYCISIISGDTTLTSTSGNICEESSFSFFRISN